VYREFLLPGSETFILNQARALRRFEPMLAGRRRVDGLPLDGLPCTVVQSGERGAAADEALHRAGVVPRRFAASVAARRPHLVHAHFGPDALCALPLTRRLRVPLIVTFHGYDASRRTSLRDGIMHWRYGRRRPRLRREAACVLAVSEHVRGELLALGFPEELVRTHHIGVDTERFAPGGAGGNGAAAGGGDGGAPGGGGAGGGGAGGVAVDREPVVLAVGRFVEKKGFAMLIEAMRSVVREVPGGRLVLVGSGPLESELRAQVERARLGAAVEFTGPLAPGEVAAWMRRARVFGVPSVTAASGDTEGLPMTLLEAMASALPPVGTRHAGIPEAIADGDSGLLVAERDAPGLASALAALLTRDPLWERLSAGARRTACERFDLARQTALLEDIYEEVVSCCSD
jgi:glycosyltransferase involved in cell wall biosynthesis